MATKDMYKGRGRIIQGVFILAATLLILSALNIQVIDPEYRERAQATTVNKYTLYPSRGLIYDRNGKLLVINNAIYDLKVTYKQLDPAMDTLHLCRILDIDRKTFEKNIKPNFRSARYSKSVPFVFMSKISAKTCASLQEVLYKFPGFSLQLRNVRGYPHRNAAHVLGYLSEVNPKQIEASDGKYQGGDYIGSTGLESYYEEELRGRKGTKFILKDNLGRSVGPFKGGAQDSAAVSGLDLISALDIDLQAYGESLLKNKTGSIVAIEPKTGEVLSMISAPTYDPNLLTINRDRGKAFNYLMQDSLKPFLDRSIMAEYPPGSIFKTLVALAGMEEGTMRGNTGHSCSGGYTYNGTTRGCHHHAAPYSVGIALEHSCNTYFFQEFRKIIDQNGFYNPEPGMDAFVDYCYQFGLGEPLGIDLPNESDGNVPTTEYYDRLYPKDEGGWKSPTIMSVGIGQGEIQMTTLQMANLAAIIANEGYYYVPHLVRGFRPASTRIAPRFLEKKTIPVNKSFYPAIADGMRRVVRTGTATMVDIPDIEICGKTGTSQNPHGKDHSVFFAFAPRENPKIAIAVYVEHGIWGASYAAPIASLMIEKYLKGTIAEDRIPLQNKMMDANLIADNP